MLSKAFLVPFLCKQIIHYSTAQIPFSTIFYQLQTTEYVHDSRRMCSHSDLTPG